MLKDEKCRDSCLPREELPADEIQKSGTVYDDVFRTMIDKLPHLLIPLINEVFSHQYSDSEPVTALQNEHMEITLGKVITDSYLRVADRYYHIECQCSPDGTMAIRMIEYDFLIALKHARKSSFEYTIEYPESCVLYLRYTGQTPDFLTVHMKFPGGAVIDYQIPVIKVNQYDMNDIFEKKLLFLLPYYIMRYEKELPKIEQNKAKLKRLLDEYGNIYQNLDILRRRQQISEYDLAELRQLIRIILCHVASGNKQIQKGISEMGGKVLEFEHDILMKQGEAKGEARELVKNVDTIMRTLKMSLEEACEAMEITAGEYTRAKKLIHISGI